ncbi:hypothetical protein N475_21265 [Pseudoalteromonas luteoviolacea DSM 6061]|uniref:Uncharacterized protein n=1 Tax=Pseudoalteromonas luteoviolacea DSM 6061 TaxID=1365250 RepID=A0A166VGC5_9GAMM|nr:hypothetical protein N475_21265 [Pseudoalteromonas luteoviolacea DSM 6061]
MSSGLGASKEKVKGSREDKGYSTGCADIGNVIRIRSAEGKGEEESGRQRIQHRMCRHRKCH